MIEIELPFPPSVNHYYRRVGPRTLISREGRAFRVKVCSVLASLGIKPMLGPLEVHVEVFPPDRRRRDIDNVQKALLDALEHAGAYRDDSQIVKLVAEKRECVPGGRTIVRIRRLKNGRR
ncbi:MAG: RusA family crossover junction endodeoxyribonuclease [Planctomycetota bacterium]|nr:MAG: RusA family crossover junction endodeoxyribonuclease [Planctomycetota bacterium]